MQMSAEVVARQQSDRVPDSDVPNIKRATLTHLYERKCSKSRMHNAGLVICIRSRYRRGAPHPSNHSISDSFPRSICQKLGTFSSNVIE